MTRRLRRVLTAYSVIVIVMLFSTYVLFAQPHPARHPHRLWHRAHHVRIVRGHMDVRTNSASVGRRVSRDSARGRAVRARNHRRRLASTLSRRRARQHRIRVFADSHRPHVSRSTIDWNRSSPLSLAPPPIRRLKLAFFRADYSPEPLAIADPSAVARSARDTT